MVAIATDIDFSPEGAASPIDRLGPLEGLSDEVGRALDLALWTFDFRGDLEDALDDAFLRSVLSGTPTLTGGLIGTAA